MTHIVVRPESLLVRSDRGVHEWSRADIRWRKAIPKAAELPAYTRGIYAGRDGVWASNQHRELFRWDHTTEEDALLEKTWTSPDPLHQRGGYGVRFVAEHGDHVWFGGWPRTCFVSSGLYRLNLATGVLDEFGPADSFRLCPQHRIDDGLWIGDRLWLATSQGLCVVRERE